jgi:hypothetical protein
MGAADSDPLLLNRGSESVTPFGVNGNTHFMLFLNRGSESATPNIENRLKIGEIEIKKAH